jgi:hypothetical protein
MLNVVLKSSIIIIQERKKERVERNKERKKEEVLSLLFRIQIIEIEVYIYDTLR